MKSSSRRHPRTTITSQTVLTVLIAALLAFYAGLTIGSATAHQACANEEQIIQQRIQRALQKQAQAQQQQQQQAPPPDASDTDPRFPTTVSDIATGMAVVDRDDFASYLNLGVPLDATTEHNAQVLLLYQNAGSVPSSNPFRATAAVSAVPPPDMPSVQDAVASCDYLNLILSDHNHNRNQCWAIMGQYEAFHVQKYMRVVEGQPVHSGAPLKLVNRGYQASGRKSMKTPSAAQSAQYWGILQTYLATLDDVLTRLAPVAAAAAGNGDTTIIVMVCNAGQSELLLNFLCAAAHRHIADLKHVLIFATDPYTYDLVTELQLPVHVFYDAANYGDMPEGAARRYADTTFMKMMMAKVFCVHMTMRLGYHVVFQDADVLWYRSPLDYFKEQQHAAGATQFDAYFQDDGNHALFYAPYSANTGFYYLRHNERTMALVNSLLMQGDLIITTKSHQIPLTFLLQEMASLHGLTIKVWNARTTDEFPGGHAFHRRKSFMRDLIAGHVQPYLFHMSWTASSVNKVKFWQQMGEWYVADACRSGGGGEKNENKNAGQSCCLAQPVEQCHYRDKPSKHPCKDSPTIDKNGRDWW